MAERVYSGISRADKIKIGLLVALVAAVPTWIVAGFVRDRLEVFFSGARTLVFGQVMMAILLEAVPFVLIGAIVSGTVEVFVAPERLASVVPRRLGSRLALAAAAGLLFPVCECGVVPLVRRLIRKGLPLEMAMVFLLAAPIVNPTVIASTFAAFVGQDTWLAMPVARVGVGVTVAMATGAALQWWSRRHPLDEAKVVPAGGAHTHEGPALLRVLQAVVHDFMLIGGYLLVGSILAAAFQSFVPRTALVALGQTPVAATGSMMALAYGLNVCSEADAFIAAAFSQFSFASRLAFLVFGPMLDMKLTMLYLGALPKRMLLAVVFVAGPLVVIVCELVGLLWQAIR